MTSPLIEACTITELEAFLDINPSQLCDPTSFAETLSFWKETEIQTDSDLLRRLQQIEDEVREKTLLGSIDDAVFFAVFNEYICLHGKKNLQYK